MYDTRWFTFFPPSATEMRRIAERLCQIAPRELSESRALDVTAFVFGYESYANVLEYLAFDWGYPVKWDHEIDKPTMSDRLRFQTNSLAKCLRVTSKCARGILDQWKPSSSTAATATYGMQARMHEAKRELERLGAGLDAEYMQRLSETFHPYKQTVAETIVQDTRQDSTYALRARLEVNSVATSIAKLFVPVEVVRRRARDLRKLIQKEGFCHGHALELIAKLFGFDGYSQLHRNAPIELMGRETLAWDENLSADELASRYSVQAELLSRTLELDGNDARSLLEAWRPTAILDAYEELRRGATEEVDSGDSEDAVRENAYASTKPIPNDSIGKRPIVTIRRHRHVVHVEDGAPVTPHLATESNSHG